MTAPFLRWAGSKRRLLPYLLPLCDGEIGTYYEPFVGAGSLFFSLSPRRAILGDALHVLVDTYQTVRASPSAILAAIEKWPVDRDTFYEVRALRGLNEVEAAAQFIYLNKTCWNGLYRVNAQGSFNVPFGRPKSSWITSAEILDECSTALKNAEISASDFEATVFDARSGDLVYFDPPYVTGHNDKGFLEYNEKLFSWGDQVRLRDVAAELRGRGVRVVISNADHPEVRALYEDFHVTTVKRQSTLASKQGARREITELIVVG